MGLSRADLASRHELLDKLVAYHVLPNARADAKALRAAAGAAGAYGVSGDPHYLLRFTAPAAGAGAKGAAAAGGLAVRDARGNAAAVVSPDLDAGRSVVHAVDAVLHSGEYFPTLKDFAAFYGANFSSLAAAFEAAGRGSELASNAWGGTLFAPIEGGFAAGAALLPELGRLKGGAGGSGAGRVREVVEYAQVGPGGRGGAWGGMV
jgi:hypothetical protein